MVIQLTEIVDSNHNLCTEWSLKLCPQKSDSWGSPPLYNFSDSDDKFRFHLVRKALHRGPTTVILKSYYHDLPSYRPCCSPHLLITHINVKLDCLNAGMSSHLRWPPNSHSFRTWFWAPQQLLFPQHITPTSLSVVAWWCLSPYSYYPHRILLIFWCFTASI